MDYNKVPKGSNFFSCILCDYNGTKKGQYARHLMTAKHKRMTLDDADDYKKGSNDKYKCNCGSIYKHRQGLYKHKKVCQFGETTSTENKSITTPQDYNLVMDLIKQNNELQKQLIEMSKEIKTITTNSHNNNNNTQFNLQFFLNETCKNAINFSEFIDNINVSYNDLENNAKMGFVGGITNVIVENLKQLELNHRPIHCTDGKRETIYVKEEDQWEKDRSKEVIEKGIQELTRKNMCQLSEWRENHPEYEDMESELGEQSMVMQQNSMAGTNRDEFYPKIIKNIIKETTIDKDKVM